MLHTCVTTRRDGAHPCPQAALRRVWTRMVWREALPPRLAAALPGPDAFETVMDVLRQKLAARRAVPPKPNP